MNERLFRWHLSGGAKALAMAGFFWFGLSFGVTTYKWGLWAWGLSATLQFGLCAVIFGAAVRLSPGAVGRGERASRENNRASRAFVCVVVAQIALLAPTVWWCVHTGAKDRLWPSIGLVVSLHFAPLARLFHVRAYYSTAIAGTVISLVGLSTGVGDVQRLLWFGGAMAAVMWLSGWHIIRNADQIAATATAETWAV